MAEIFWLKLAGSLLGVVHSTLAQPAPDVRPDPAARQVEKQVNAPVALTADELLSRLEKSDENITTIQGALIYTKTMVIAGDQQTRTGSLYFTSKVNPTTKERSRTFAIQFDRLFLGTRVEDRHQQYIFDGEWLIEKMPDEKQIIKRQVVKPGEKFDPLKIGEGPLPIPIGQKKADILSRYDVSLVDSEEGLEGDELKKFAASTWQLKLIPKVGADRNFKEIRLWYREASDVEGKPILPRMARTVDTADDVSLVQLLDSMTVNKAIDPEKFDTSKPDATWSEDVHPYRQ